VAADTGDTGTTPVLATTERAAVMGDLSLGTVGMGAMVEAVVRVRFFLGDRLGRVAGEGTL
jgi:hypothetical protein